MKHDDLFKQAMEEKRKLEKSGLVPQITTEQLRLVKTAGEESERLRQSGITPDLFFEFARSKEAGKAFADLAKNFAPVWAHSLPEIRLGIIESVKTSRILDAITEASEISMGLAPILSNHSLQFELYKLSIAGVANLARDFQPDLNKLAVGFAAGELSALTANSLAAQNVLAGLDLSRIGSAFLASDDLRQMTTIAFEDFSNSYKDLLLSFQAPETSLYTLPPEIAYYPPVELVNSVTLVETTIGDASGGHRTNENQSLHDEIRAESHDTVILLLEGTNRDWIGMLEGARQAITSSNPDKIRHSLTSLRELSTHILHHFSPDADVKRWSTSEKDFHDGRPTRRARLRYITRNIDSEPFSEFLEKDIEAFLAALDLFHSGTHNPKSNFTEEQVEALIARFEGTILFLFKVANSKGEM